MFAERATSARHEGGRLGEASLPLQTLIEVNGIVLYTPFLSFRGSCEQGECLRRQGQADACFCRVKACRQGASRAMPFCVRRVELLQPVPFQVGQCKGCLCRVEVKQQQGFTILTPTPDTQEFVGFKPPDLHGLFA